MKAFRIGDQIMSIPDPQYIDVMRLDREFDVTNTIEGWYLYWWVGANRFQVYLGRDEIQARAMFNRVIDGIFSEGSHSCEIEVLAK